MAPFGCPVDPETTAVTVKAEPLDTDDMDAVDEPLLVVVSNMGEEVEEVDRVNGVEDVLEVNPSEEGDCKVLERNTEELVLKVNVEPVDVEAGVDAFVVELNVVDVVDEDEAELVDVDVAAEVEKVDDVDEDEVSEELTVGEARCCR
ncbi:hypothetical protein K439DRAFT_901839 [Ramaria rubella]|nr:hypothetical protein K439DRAFT_901839 [Ramaria rubella]